MGELGKGIWAKVTWAKENKAKSPRWNALPVHGQCLTFQNSHTKSASKLGFSSLFYVRDIKCYSWFYETAIFENVHLKDTSRSLCILNPLKYILGKGFSKKFMKDVHCGKKNCLSFKRFYFWTKVNLFFKFPFSMNCLNYSYKFRTTKTFIYFASRIFWEPTAIILSGLCLDKRRCKSHSFITIKMSMNKIAI